MIVWRAVNFGMLPGDFCALLFLWWIHHRQLPPLKHSDMWLHGLLTIAINCMAFYIILRIVKAKKKAIT